MFEDTPLNVDAAHGVLANDADVDSPSLTVTQFTVNGVAGVFSAGSTASLASGSLTINTDGSYSFTPAANYNGPVPVATYTVSDGSLTSTATLTLAVTPVNDAPAGADRTVTTLEDTGYTLSRADFGFSDAADAPSANNFASVTVGPTTAGTLTLNNVVITSATSVSVADLDAGLLVFHPAADANGNGYATLQFQVKDDGGTANGGVDTDPTPNTITFNVTRRSTTRLSRSTTSRP